MKKDMNRLCVHSHDEYLSAMAFFKRVEKRRCRNKLARKQRKSNRR